jgi:hypothetical protein
MDSIPAAPSVLNSTPRPRGLSKIWHSVVRPVRSSISLVFTSILLGGLGLFPLLVFIPLGYLFQSQRQIALQGRLDHAVPDAYAWERFWGKAITWGAILWPLGIVDGLFRRASLIDPDDHVLAAIVYILPAGWLAVLIHLTLMEMRGDSTHLIHPISNILWWRSLSTQEQSSHLTGCLRSVGKVISGASRLFVNGVRGNLAVGS